MRTIRSCDCETTTINKGDPYHPDNKLVSLGFYDGKEYIDFYKEFNLEQIQELVDTSILVFTNGKFDLSWLRRIGIDISRAIVRDVQLAEFLISNQTHAYASLNECAATYLAKQKLDVVKTEYWDKGIDTWFIPSDILLEYQKEDCILTYEVYMEQVQLLEAQNKWNLFLLQCADLLELQEMEWNGILFNKEESLKKGNALNNDIEKLKEYILSYTHCPSFNCASGDHLSCLLYGGTITHTTRLPVGFYKTGAKTGLPRYRVQEEYYEQSRLVEPLKGSELKKNGYYSTDEQTLLSLRSKEPIKTLIKAILELSKLEKLQGTYFFGIPKLMDEQGWENNLIHGQLNQCVARTGRLSASKPNQQNFDPELKKLCESRYA